MLLIGILYIFTVNNDNGHSNANFFKLCGELMHAGTNTSQIIVTEYEIERNLIYCSVTRNIKKSFLPRKVFFFGFLLMLSKPRNAQIVIEKVEILLLHLIVCIDHRN